MNLHKFKYPDTFFENNELNVYRFNTNVKSSSVSKGKSQVNLNKLGFHLKSFDLSALANMRQTQRIMRNY